MSSPHADRRIQSPLAGLLAAERPAAESRAAKLSAIEGLAGRRAASRAAAAVIEGLRNGFYPLLITLHTGEQILAAEGGAIEDDQLVFSLAPLKQWTKLPIDDVAACQPLTDEDVAALASVGERVVVEDRRPVSSWHLHHARITAISGPNLTVRVRDALGSSELTVLASNARYPGRYPFDPDGSVAYAR
jgi:hypothetical protein